MNAMTMRMVRGAGGEIRHVPAPYVPTPAKRGRKKRVAPDPLKASSETAAQQLKLFIERVERMQEEIAGMQADVADVYLEAKGQGYDTATMKAIIALRKKDPNSRQEAEALLETYKAALGLG